MKHELYEKTEQLVRKSFEKAGNSDGLTHFLRTVHWVKILKPEADEAMLIAAVAHDIERAYRDREKMAAYLKKGGFRDKDFLGAHQAKGAEIIGKFLEGQNVDRNLIERVKKLIEKHEVGGDEDQNIIKDADSISFFENNIDHFVGIKTEEEGRDAVKDKFDWMYDRISTDKAKRIVNDWYLDAIKKLNR